MVVEGDEIEVVPLALAVLAQVHQTLVSAQRAVRAY
jgi:hypothetical protein